ncbi:DUF4157 domain-containing protein [Flavobacterium sp. MC2016-06]|jgi:hypothetical protein|uniref:eCIS core domain-containing protein n=1 Tax=Flavobacterium sp. MC2016-06 TaxID=2676308 RepID=UPI0012BAC627|nr:DUF4157 domain-containing protein [Flavobacterium sp. MC2016-06]MBU3857615.1 DUF4157 domain-containing protein [Flavobacterium sp. MC2016-06]
MSAFSPKVKSAPSRSSFNSRKGEDFFGVQAKLNIGKSNDKYEVEADNVADKVVSKKQNNTSESFFNPSPVVQKKTNEPQKENENTVQEKSLAGSISSVTQLKTEKEETIQNKIETPKTAEKNLSPKPLIQQKKTEEEVQTKEEEEIQKKEDEKEVQMSAAADANPSDTSNLESTLNSSKGGGAPLSGKVKNEMESGFGTDFSNVRIHNNSTAVQMNKQLGSQAFATGNNIYFNEGKYNPSSQEGKHLLAHELTHTVQQGAAIRKKPEQVTPAPEMIQGSFLDLLPNWIIDEARHIPGYTLFTVIVGYDPLRQIDVERTPINLVEGLMGLIPFGTAIFDKLQEYGILQQVFDWVQGKLGEIGLTIDSILKMVEDVWDEVSFPYTDIIDLIVEKFNELVNRVKTFVNATVDQVITWIKEALIDVAEPILAENKAWSLIKKIIKYDPLRNEEVNATTVEILEDFLILIGKETELEQMREKGTLQKTADWLDTQVGTFTSLLGELRGLITAAWDAIQPANLMNITDNLSALAAQAGGFLQRVWDFALGVALKVLELVKESLLGWLSSQASTVRGYSLIKVIIGRDPFTNETVERSVPNLIRGFMSLMDGGEEQYAQMVESGAIARITGQIEAAVATLNMTPESIIQLFTDLWNSFTIDDLIHPLDAFIRIIEKFGEPIGRLIAFVAEIVRIVIVAILEIMNFPFDLIGNIITRAMEAIEDIKKDPIGFLKNILRAIKQGFVQFFDNIVTHLIGGVTGWLMSELKDANIPVLTDFSLQGVISWVLEVLGISMEKIWEKLAAHPRIGAARVARIRGMINTLEGIWTFIKDVQERGMAAIWDKIQEQLSNLWNTILESVKNFVMERIVNQITARLLSMLDPTGIMAVINSAMALYSAIQSFIKYLREMLEVVNSFVNGVADIAKGNVATAANYLERTMGDAMPIVIGFLANQVGLSGIGARVGEMIVSVRQMVDEALTWLVNQAVDRGMAMLDRLMGRGGEDGLTAVRQNLHQEEETHLTNGGITHENAQAVAQTVAARNNTLVSSIQVVDGGNKWNYNLVQRTAEEGKNKAEGSSGTHEGTFVGSDENKTIARTELATITVSMVGNGIDQDVLDRYKGTADGYLKYLGTKGSSAMIQWPLTYLKSRASRRRGRTGEDGWVKEQFGDSAGKNNRTYNPRITNDDGTTQVVPTIPDYVVGGEIGDVKDVNYQSYTEQLKAIKQVARDEGKSFSLIIRKDDNPNGKTGLSSNLSNQIQTGPHKIITPEEASSE